MIHCRAWCAWLLDVLMTQEIEPFLHKAATKIQVGIGFSGSSAYPS